MATGDRRSEIDWNLLDVEEVVYRLLGEPRRDQMTRDGEWRYGNHGSLSVDLDKRGAWRDHENDEGGSLFDLIARERGCDRRGVVEWLRGENLLPDARSTSGRSNGHGKSKPTKGPLKRYRVDDPWRRKNEAGGWYTYPPPTAVYDYLDEAGVLAYQVLRFQLPKGKTFRQQRPVGEGWWVRSLDGVRRVPYRLPEMLEDIALGRTIFVVEGEKDVDRLRDLGVPATSNSQGAGYWSGDLDACFPSGADLVVVQDNDAAGRKHADVVARHLTERGCRVRVLDLTESWMEAPKGADASDWFDAGRSLDDLLQLAERAPIWIPPRSGNGGYPKIVQWRKVDDGIEPKWFVTLEGCHGELQVDDTVDLWTYRRFQMLCLKRLHVSFLCMKQDTWCAYLAEALATLVVERAEVDVTDEERFREVLEEWLVNRNASSKSRDEVLMGRAYEDEGEGRFYFLMKGLEEHCERSGMKGLRRSQMAKWIRAMGGDAASKSPTTIKKRSVRLWYVPSAQFSRGEPLSVPPMPRNPI